MSEGCHNILVRGGGLFSNPEMQAAFQTFSCLNGKQKNLQNSDKSRRKWNKYKYVRLKQGNTCHYKISRDQQHQLLRGFHPGNITLL